MAAALPMIPPVGAEERLLGILEWQDAALLAWLDQHGEQPWRARQLRQALLVRGATAFDQMTELPRALRAKLAKSFQPLSGRVTRHLRSSDDTHKLLV